MKKIKEFIKKIGNKKRCLLSLLLAGLLIFAIVSGLNGSKSAKTEVNAISAPTKKNLDLNGVRYTYQTSLNDLKNTYGFFKYQYTEELFAINNSTEGETQLAFYGFTDPDYFNDEHDIANTIIDESFKFKINNEIANNDVGEDEVSNSGFGPVFLFNGIANFNELQELQINFNNLKNLPKYRDDFNGSFLICFYFLKDELDNSRLEEERYMYNNSIRYCYSVSNNIEEYTFKLPSYDGYTCRNILCTFANSTLSNENTIFSSTIVSYLNHTQQEDLLYNTYISIDNLKFVPEDGANIITFNTYYSESGSSPVYKGNILLSEKEYDTAFINDIASLNNAQEKFGQVNLTGGAYFGGKFEENAPSGTIFYKLSEVGINPVTRDLIYVETKKNYYGFIINNMPINKGIIYFDQNRLLYLEDINTLNGTFDGEEYDALSAQVEDILYNVNYIGNISEEEFNAKVEDDFTDLLKTTGIGAVIGLLIGFLVGNPIGGLVVGAVIGFAVAIIPLIIDGLQAIFGYDFLSGLYSFFNGITEFFVNIIDTIVNFLFSIITNPFVLVLIVIVAILYIFLIRPKTK